MAESWIKMRTDLAERPQVVRIASALHADKLRVIGALWRVWCWFDTHSDGGVVPGFTGELLDAEVGVEGLSAALCSVGWMAESPKGLTLPNFQKHNGGGAKRRALESVRKVSARHADKLQTKCASESESESEKEILNQTRKPAPKPGGVYVLPADLTDLTPADALDRIGVGEPSRSALLACPDLTTAAIASEWGSAARARNPVACVIARLSKRFKPAVGETRTELSAELRRQQAALEQARRNHRNPVLKGAAR